MPAVPIPGQVELIAAALGAADLQKRGGGPATLDTPAAQPSARPGCVYGVCVMLEYAVLVSFIVTHKLC